MRILSYQASSTGEDTLVFDKIEFGKLNLIVGNSGAGKTRLLNTIFNAATSIVQNKLFTGGWDLIFEHEGQKYHWIFESEKFAEDDKKIVRESLARLSDDTNPNEVSIINRTQNTFTFNDQEIPKLDQRASAISLLKDEDEIRPIFEAFSLIMRRNFSGSDLETEGSYQAIPQKLLKKIKSKKNLNDLYQSGLNLSCKLFILSEQFKEIYEQIAQIFKNTFPFIDTMEFADAEKYGFSYPGIVPVLSFKEKFSNKYFPLHQLSSGMKKVLLILCDLFLLPKEGTICLIDEYENSLGINAINFFPSILFEGTSNKSQFIITSHHPYIIGNMPVKNWIILNRRGNKVRIKQGRELENQYGKSKQKAFIQLINDPFFAEGVE